MFPSVQRSLVPVVTRDQMVEVDRIMVEDLGIDLVRMMENAGRALARFVITNYESCRASGGAAVLAGTGGNGGGALVAARRLAGWGAPVTVYTTRPMAGYAGVVAEQLEIVSRLGVLIVDDAIPPGREEPSLIIDGLIGYSLSGAPRGRAAALISWVASAAGPVIALDVPSGVDATSGDVYEPAIAADATMTLALPKIGLAEPNARTRVGDLYVCDIGVPASLYRNAFGVDASGLFNEGDIIRIVEDA